jgi:hypothetical protein
MIDKSHQSVSNLHLCCQGVMVCGTSVIATFAYWLCRNERPRHYWFDRCSDSAAADSVPWTQCC